MSDVKQVKVDNWGIYFLQRLKHFFNRTDYCDLTLQFQDNAQLKVHRLVLSACTEYFEILERTCEMYEDCLVMPDDLQADVVVPIVNFMYTGHLEFRMDLLERLYQTSQILNMPVLSKLLEAHRHVVKSQAPAHSYSAPKRFPKTISESSKLVKPTSSGKRSYSKAFENNKVVYRDKKVYQPLKMRETTTTMTTTSYRPPSPVPSEPSISNTSSVMPDSRPTRYELPEELDTDNVFDNSFCNISYTCKPLMIHPETVKRYTPKRSGIFSEASSSKKILPGTSTVDIVECKRITKDDNIFDDNVPNHSLNEDLDIFQASYSEAAKDTNQLFDQMLDDGPKVTIETKDSKVASNLDHAKIISEVLKKYPHLVKSNKNIKLKILNTPNKGKKAQKLSPSISQYVEEKPIILKTEPDYTYETDVIDSQQAAKLIALGAENTKGPWICLICGTPGKALHFTSYYKFRRHLVDVHNEKPVSNICEYCGLRSLKRNYLLHHLYSQHNVPPPAHYHFPKCDKCNYIALTEGFLVKHKLTHAKAKSFRCNVCSSTFNTTNQLLQHIQSTGHKYSAERKTNLQCIYCLKTFLRHGNLYAHLKTNHEKEAKNDGIIDDSDEEKPTKEVPIVKVDNREAKYQQIKFEPSTSYDMYNENIYEEVDVQYQIQEDQDGEIQLTPSKQHKGISNQQHNLISNTPKQKILNPGFSTPKPAQKAKPIRKPAPVEHSAFLEDLNIPSPPAPDMNEEIVVIDNIEYIMRDNQLIPRKPKPGSTEYILADMMDSASLQAVQPITSMEYTNIHNTNIIQEAQPAMMVKKATNLNQPIQIVMSNEEEYKALMSSNHPILFNNGDSSKTLTVLTAPHNATIESAAIDLDNTQSNDMMIIQEDFPLNVTEAVSTDNPNIVVVYSHPVDDENKQFQILTTGGIGSQFVQSTSIITQNYETVTTTAPAMSAHVLESQPDTTWQDNVQSANAEELTITQQSKLRDVEIQPLQNESTNNLNELPEVHLTPTLQTIVSQENLANGASNELNAINTESISQTVGQEIAEASHNMPEPPMEPVILAGEIIEQETSIAEPMNISHNDDHIPEKGSRHLNPNLIVSNDLNLETNVSNDINLETNVSNDLNTATNVSNDLNPDANVQELVENESIVKQTVGDVELLPQEQTTLDTITENSVNVDAMTTNQVAEITDNDELRSTLDDEPAQSQAYDEIVQISQAIVEDPQTSSKPEEKIQNLTSEWSEDEYDIPEVASKTLETVPNEVDVIIPANPEILEETIENIQQEVLNHVSTTTAAMTEPVHEAEIEESDNSVLEDTVSCLEEPQLHAASDIIVAPVINDSQAPENISSLLNDWEDNDSTEEKNSEDPVVENKEETTEPATENKEETTEPVTENIPKPDIRSLVSDWDDDEEENKEQ